MGYVASIKGALSCGPEGDLLKALIFVYSDTQFATTGTQPIKQYNPMANATLSDAPVAVEGQSSGLLPKGIYVISSETEKEAPQVQPAETRGGHYDSITITGKDPWPDPKLTTEQSARIHESFPELMDAHLSTFLSSDEPLSE